MDKVKLAEKIRALRKAVPLRQDDLAAKAGVSLRVIKELEGGRGNPTLESLSLVLSVLGISFGELFVENSKNLVHTRDAKEEKGHNNDILVDMAKPGSKGYAANDENSQTNGGNNLDNTHISSSDTNSDDFRDLIAILPTLDEPKISSLLQYARTLAPVDLSDVHTKKKTL